MVLLLVKNISESSEVHTAIDEHLLKLLSYVWRGELSPLSSFVGGIAGQVSFFSIFYLLSFNGHYSFRKF